MGKDKDCNDYDNVIKLIKINKTPNEWNVLKLIVTTLNVFEINYNKFGCPILLKYRKLQLQIKYNNYCDSSNIKCNLGILDWLTNILLM